MLRQKATDPRPTPPAQGNWLAGMMIGSAIMSMATHAMLFGATNALKNVTLKDG